MNMRRILSTIIFMLFTIWSGKAQKIEYSVNPISGAIGSIAVESDATRMSWLVKPDGSQYSWITPSDG